MVIEKDNMSYALNKGTYKDPNFTLEMQNNIKITGTGTVTFTFINEVF